MYSHVRTDRATFELTQVVDSATANLAMAFEQRVDAVVLCMGGISQAQSITHRVLSGGKHLVTSNKSAPRLRPRRGRRFER